MFQQTANMPAGPRSKRLGRQSDRGGIQKRSGVAVRIDKDGDLDMDAALALTRGRGGVRDERGAMHIRGTAGSGSGRGDMKAQRSSRVATLKQKAIFRGMGSENIMPHGSLHGSRFARQLGKTIGKERDLNAREGLVQIIVSGLKDSKAASNPDGGVKDLLGFLERKASTTDAPARDMVRIRKSRLDGDVLIISVRAEDEPKMTRLDNYVFAGATLSVRPFNRDSNEQDKLDSSINDVSEILKSLLSRRYSPNLKLLDLSRLGSDAELVNIGMFTTSARESKFFPALMKICDSIFATAQEKKDAVVSVSLAGNGLTTVASVTALAQTFPNILNLDLSNNQLKNLGALDGWRWKFRHLDHLILAGNPLETEEPTYKESILKWYPTLRTLDTVHVRSIDEVKAATKKNTLPIPVLSASFNDEANIAETFIKQFFAAYDSDRAALLGGYYDTQSTFSLNVNISAPRAPEAVDHKSPNWDSYIKKSRNLVKVTHPPARMSRMYTGVESIQQCWLALPSTRHPDLLLEPQKWCIECSSIPGLPDPSGQSVGGVGGLIIAVHGEFSEVDVSTGQASNKRSFDRTFVLGPGSGIGGVRVTCDLLVLRAWGGFQAWVPDAESPLATPLKQPLEHPIAVPAGFGAAVLGKTDEQIQKETAVVELSKRTGMTLEYSGMCLEQSGWALDGAMLAFEQVKANIPSEAFISA